MTSSKDWVRGIAVAVLLVAAGMFAALSFGERASSAATLSPELEGAVRSQLAAHASTTEDNVKIVRVEAVTWRDGCLGVYLPEASCLLAVQDGFVVWATAGSTGYRYHTDADETVVLAEEGIAPSSIATATTPEGVIAVPETRGTLLSGSVPASGFGLVVFGGGNYDDLVTASGCAAENARFWATVQGTFLVLVPASQVAAVNAPFEAAFAGSIASGTVLLATCPASEVSESGPPVLTASAGGNSGPMGLGAYCWQFAAGEPERCEDAGLTTTAQVLTIASGGEITVSGLPAGLVGSEALVFGRSGEGLQEGANRISWVAGGTPMTVEVQVTGSSLTLSPDLPTGSYLLSLQLEWPAGNAVFGLQFDVE